MFKVGDRVVLARPTGMAAVRGATATVVQYNPNVHFRHGDPDRYLYVQWDDTPERRGQQHGGYSFSCFDLTEKKPVTKNLDFTRPITTRDGQAVRILCTDKKGDYPIVGLVMEGAYEAVKHWLPNGRVYKLEDSVWDTPSDLINPPVKRYINLFKNDAGRMYYDTREDAEKAGNASNKANPFVGYIKTIEVEI